MPVGAHEAIQGVGPYPSTLNGVTHAVAAIFAA